MPRDRDQSAFAAMYRDHYVPVCRHLATRVERAAVEDLAAETFMVAWRRQERVPEHVRPWLLNIASKCSANHRRSHDRAATLLELIVPHLPAAGSPEEAVRQRAERRALIEALSELDSDGRELLMLRHWDGLAPREIATVLGISAVSARARLSRAQRRLQRLLDRSLLSEGLASPRSPSSRLEPQEGV